MFCICFFLFLWGGIICFYFYIVCIEIYRFVILDIDKFLFLLSFERIIECFLLECLVLWIFFGSVEVF